MRSFSVAKNLYSTGRGKCSSKEWELEAGAEFLQVTNYTQLLRVLITIAEIVALTIFDIKKKDKLRYNSLGVFRMVLN